MSRSPARAALGAALSILLASGCAMQKDDPAQGDASLDRGDDETVLAHDPENAAQLFWGRVREGGQVFVMRHGDSPHGQADAVGAAPGCILGAGRGLSAKGRAQARLLRETLAAQQAPIAKAYTSDMCRSWDTATLIAGDAEIIPHPAQKTTDPGVIAAFKRAVEAELAAHPGKTILLVNHSNIAPLYGARVCDGEAEIPEGVISVISTQRWTSIARIWPDGAVTGCARAVD